MKAHSKAPDDGKVGIVVATFGGDEWRERGAAALAESEQDDPQTKMHHLHWTGQDMSLGAVRNTGARQLLLNHDWDPDWLIFLDADDRLPSDYVTKMRAGFGDIRQPLTRGFYPDGTLDPEANRIPKVRLLRHNYIVIGAMVDAGLFWMARGFGNQPCLEDWDLWLRMYSYLNAEIGESEAIYMIGVNEGSRNQSEDHAKWYNKIKQEHQRGFRERERS